MRASQVPEANGRITFDPICIASICGLEGAGKTDFGATMPGPILYYSIDPNTEEVLEKYQDDKEIRLYKFTLPPPLLAYEGDGDQKKLLDEVKKAARAQERAFFQALGPVLRKEYPTRTKPSVVIDTGTEFFVNSLLADHGKASQIWPPEARGVTNTRWKQLLRALKECGCNVVILHRLRDEYANKTVRKLGGGTEEVRERTGDYEREGFNQIGFYINVEAFVKFDRTRDKGEQYGLQIRRCTQRPFVIGKEYWGSVEVDGEDVRAASFPFLARMVYKRSALNDWR